MEKIVQKAIKLHKDLVEKFEKEEAGKLVEITELIVKSLDKGGKIFLCGNGGSAADAQHIAGEFIGRFRQNRRSLPAIALSTDTSVLTSISNDYSFENIFSRQLEALISPLDILWVFSTSGSSLNIINAAGCARQRNAKIVAFIGVPGSILEKLSDICFCSNTKVTSAAQEIHQLAYHIICELVEIKLFSELKSKGKVGS